MTTHPIQYNAPLYALLTARGCVTCKVFYTWGEEVLTHKYDPGFNKNIEWDIPLLKGYDYCFVKNVSVNPGSHYFKGIDNPTLIDEIENWNADAVLIYGWRFKSHLRAMRYFHKNIPVYFRGDSTLLNKINPFKKLVRRLFLKWIYSKVDKALYVGIHNKNYYLKFGMKEDQLIFAPHSIDNDRFSSHEADHQIAVNTWKTELNIKPEDIGFLYAGKLDNNKNAELLLQAFSQLPQENIFLIITGNGDLEDQLKNSYASFHNIHFFPFQNQSLMPVVYRLADVFVLPSKSETWGLTINEAMACSRAILVSDVCGASIDLVNVDNGHTFKSGSLEDLKKKMAYLIQNKKELQQMGAKSREIIRNWNFENICLAIENAVTGKTVVNQLEKDS